MLKQGIIGFSKAADSDAAICSLHLLPESVTVLLPACLSSKPPSDKAQFSKACVVQITDEHHQVQSLAAHLLALPFNGQQLTCGFAADLATRFRFKERDQSGLVKTDDNCVVEVAYCGEYLFGVGINIMWSLAIQKILDVPESVVKHYLAGKA